jgi:filamentous hemagglutinin family protein
VASHNLFCIVFSLLTSDRIFKLWLPQAATLLALLSSCPTAAQITSEEALNTTVAPPDQNNVIQINGGTQPDNGANLFHGFQEFSVPNGYTAHFNNNSAIQNIFSRVTGGNPSTIDGILKANGTANLFLINPNGIIFGPNASLDIGGSFLATTADSILFNDGSEFSARATQTRPLLTVSTPIGLQWRSQPRDINVQQSILNVDPGRTLSFFGGNINLVGDIASETQGQLIAPGGRVELGGLSIPGIIELNRDGSSRFNNATRADVSLTNEMEVDVQGNNGGNIAINARNLEVLGESKLLAGIEKGQGSPNSQAGDIEIDATGIVTLDENSEIANTIEQEAEGQGGKININTGSLLVTNGAGLNTNLVGVGKAGDININARDIVSLDGVSNESSSRITSSVGQLDIQQEGGQGQGGNINITTGSLSVTNGAALSSSTIGNGNAGNVDISARDTVVFDGVGSNDLPSNISSTVGIIFPEPRSGQGNGGNIKITTGSLLVRNGAFLAANSLRDRGNAGDINIYARDLVFVEGVSQNGIPSAVISTLGRNIRGKAGSINVNTGSLIVSNGAVLGTFTVGQGDAGNILINATRSVELSGLNVEEIANDFTANKGLIDSLSAIFGFSPIGISTGLYSTTETEAQGKGGDITVTTPSFRVANGAIVNAQTLNNNQGGNITITTDRFEAINGGQLITSTDGIGNAGAINLTAKDRILLSGSDPTFFARAARAARAARVAGVRSNTVRNQGSRSGLFANTGPNASGIGGDIQLETDFLFLDNGASISAGTDRSQGGNITIDAQFIVASPDENNDIVANALEGQGGNINIETQGIFGLQEREAVEGNNTNDIDASSDLGIDGVVNITNPEVDPTAGAIELTSTPVDADALIAQDVCKVEDGKIAGGSSFVVTGRGGLPPSAEDPLVNSYRIVEWATRSQQQSDNSTVVLRDRPQTSQPEQSSPAIEQAQGWKIASDGTLMLTAQATTPTPLNPALTHPECRDK